MSVCVAKCTPFTKLFLKVAAVAKGAVIINMRPKSCTLAKSCVPVGQATCGQKQKRELHDSSTTTVVEESG